MKLFDMISVNVLMTIFKNQNLNLNEIFIEFQYIIEI